MCVSVCLGTQTSLSGPYDLKHKQIQSWLDESAATCRILPPRAVQTLIRGMRKKCMCVCVSLTMSALCAFTPGERGKAPPLLVFHSAAFVIGQSQEFFNNTLAPCVLTCHDDQADKKKTRRGERHSVSWLPHCFYKTCHSLKHMTERNPAQFISRTHLTWKNSRNAPRGVSV